MSELAANTPEERAHELIRLLTRLTDLFNEETRLFKAQEPRHASAFQGEKTRLATIYRRETQMAKSDPTRLQGLPADLKSDLQSRIRTFEAAVQKNGIAVEALRKITEGVVKSIADEAIRQKKAKSGYGPSHGMDGKIGAIAVNQSA